MKDKKKDSTSALKSLAVEAKNSARRKHQTYESAIEAIVSLESDIQLLKGMLIAAKTKKPAHRPRKLLPHSISMLPAIYEKAEKKSGRPQKHINPKATIKSWDKDRRELAIHLGKRTISDKATIEYIIPLWAKSRGITLKRDQKADIIKEWRSHIKQMRDKTGIRMHKRTKAENPRKK